MIRKIYEIPIEEVFVKNSTYTRSHLKSKLLKYKLLPLRCKKCGIGEEWNGEPLTLQIDHINGVSNDNRLENLRFLCPNCHSQTSTYAGANTKNRKEGILNKCKHCGNYCSYNSEQQCIKCYHKRNPRFNWPSDEELTALLKTKSAFQISKDLKVSAPALYKHFKKKGIEY